MVWEENKKKIEEHNAEFEEGKTGFCMGLNEFSDLTSDEFWEVMTCSSDSILEDQDIINMNLFSDIQEFEDLTNNNNETPEKDQYNALPYHKCETPSSPTPSPLVDTYQRFFNSPPTVEHLSAHAYRGSRKKPKKDKVLVSLLHSTLGRLVDTISFCQILRQDASDEVYEPEATNNTHLPPRQQVEESAVSNLSLVSSSAPLKEQLLPKDSKALSPVLLNSSSVSIESQSSVAASQPPETLTPGRPHSPQQAPSSPSHPPDPVTYPPSVPDPSTVVVQCVCKALGTSQSTPLPVSYEKSLITLCLYLGKCGNFHL
ncbi:protein CTLA-2-beta-like protein [Cricetulus griseus]|uniref:Protein CTLA-2-beta-like protein n=1 Tax=Cricetulus griseus TaxID=10029 RepID=A0A061IBD6_CRIGR|nr:protein CTLA-2-beta-like protein [Cricetulus griseus]